MIGKTRTRGFVIGAGAVAVACLVHVGRGLRDFEDWAYDQRMRRFNTIRETDRIVHIDLTDQTFDLIAPWPWPRRLTADLIRTLHELGAEFIALDIEFKRPKDPRQTTLGEIIEDDGELSAAIAEAGSVYVPLSFKMLPPKLSAEKLRAEARNVVAANPDITQAEFSRRLGADDYFGQAGLLRFKIGGLLRNDFGLSSGEIAQRLGVSTETVDGVLTGVKRAVAQELAARFLQANPAADAGRVQTQFLAAPCDPDAEDPDCAELREAAAWWASMRAVLNLAARDIRAAADRIPKIVSPRPPIERIGRPAAGTGFVAIAGQDNVVRRTALLARYGDHVIKQLGFAIACEAAGIGDSDIRVTPDGVLEFPNPRDPGGTLRVPLDEWGRVLLNWSPGRPDPSGRKQAGWLASFAHVPAARIMEIPLYRREIEKNERVRRLAQARAVELTSPRSVFDAYWEQVRKLEELRRSPLDEQHASQIAKLSATVRAAETRALDALTLARQEWQEAPPETPQDKKESEEVQRIYRDLVEGHLRARLDRLKREYEQTIEQQIEALRPLIAGKICLVGYTASAIADMKPTPVYGFAPGVMVYSNIINQVLAGRMPRYAPAWVSLAATIVCGLAVAWVAASVPAIASALIWLFISLLYAALNVLIYRQSDIFVALVAPLAAMLGAWGVVTAYRQLTEERERRRFSKALSQYVSPAVARRLALQADRMDFSPVAREVTCYFSDLKGFTPLSERLGAERTRAVLNPYLETMSRTLHQHDAMINKFMGDGIFAFFNAPIFACEQHASRACESALAAFEALEQLKSDPPAGAPGAELTALSMRVGIATGTVFVGDYGSDTKLDYTAIGDSVNLAARLEPANKALGTRIAVAESTRKLAGDDFVFRRLGRIQVLGKTEGVSVHELLGRSGEVDENALRHAEAFENGLDALQSRDFNAARSGFEQCLSQRPDDLCARRYLQMIPELQARPAHADRLPVIELTSK